MAGSWRGTGGSWKGCGEQEVGFMEGQWLKQGG